MTSLPDQNTAARLHVPPVHAPTASRLSNPVLLVLFLAAITQPYYMTLGTIVIGPYRAVLLLAAIPLMINWLRGKYGGILLPDILLLGFMIWMPLSMLVNGQASRIIVYVGSQFADIFVAYLLGRAAIRNTHDFAFFAKAFLILLLFLLPFAVLESVQGKMILQNAFRGLPNLSVYQPTTLFYPERWGLKRAMTSLDHPIIYGLVCSTAVSFGLVGLRHAGGDRSLLQRLVLSAGSLGGVFFSLSSGAFISMVIQLGLITWDWALRTVQQRWKLLSGLFVATYVFLEVAATRPPLLLMAQTIAFSGGSAWNRYLIWQFGSDEVMRHPIFGMGIFTEWTRAHWMPASIDNFWLLMAMRFGLVGFGLLAAMWIILIVRLIRKDMGGNPALCEIRKAYLFVFTALVMALGTVAVWNVSVSVIFMLTGSMVWLLYTDHASTAPGPGADAAAPGPRQKYSRARPTAAPSRTRPPKPGAARPAPERAPPATAPRYTRFPQAPDTR